MNYLLPLNPFSKLLTHFPSQALSIAVTEFIFLLKIKFKKGKEPVFIQKVGEPYSIIQRLLGAGIWKWSKHKNNVDTQVKWLKENVI